MLLSAVLILFIPILLLFLVPIDLEGFAVAGSKPEISIVWLFGLKKKKLFLEDGTGKETSGESTEKQELSHPEPSVDLLTEEPQGETERKSSSWGGREILSIIQTQGLAGNLKRLLRDLVRAIGIRYLRICLHIGFDDPADTGLAAGCLWSAAGYLQSLYPIEIEIKPSFCQEVLEGEGQGSLRIWPFLVVLSVLRFTLSRPAIRAFLSIIKIIRRRRQISMSI